MTTERPPIDLPDDFGTDDEGHADRVVIISAAAILLAVAIIAAILIWSFG